jgi:hypothetical protein
MVAPLEERLMSAFAKLAGIASRQVFFDERLQIAGIGRSREAMHPF